MCPETKAYMYTKLYTGTQHIRIQVVYSSDQNQ